MRKMPAGKKQKGEMRKENLAGALLSRMAFFSFLLSPFCFLPTLWV
jgi:hypothetical protein